MNAAKVEKEAVSFIMVHSLSFIIFLGMNDDSFTQQ